ncbi:CATRA conflict system CASPASE/TPR repeat-associated protein [Dactylosporangium sp. AC04546]|uniref:CATRA conflict system CASPASE/TPR repeat-associated protein n=1 Tax=Dactylosporangium sp. AC04546 TaxID=2862460 RepID=UPI001EE005E9|nr:CATRA conflict system CASPASE/TPR repeat-associated protein [Dactylosporangium sp. AC04546]WVK88661.1 CATRA conflict system CASPASE/TPR repeat-associated protein [Dactylosporangium sp. AC04546]
MATSRLVEHEFVAHLFAPLTGPAVGAADRQLRALWEQCRDQLGMSQAIVEVGLGTRLPEDPGGQPDGPLAALQDPAANFQAVARREHDVFNVSLVMAAPLAPPRRRLGIGSATPPSWQEFHRWWRLLSGGGLDALIGVLTVYQAKSRQPAATDVRAALPAQDDDAAAWWTHGLTVEDFALWDVTAKARPARRLVVVARPDEDARLSRFTWSAGDPALPPLGRYLMHAAKLGYQARVRGDGAELAGLRERATERMDRLTQLLGDPAGGPTAADRAELAADEATLAGTLERLRGMRRTVAIARGNMATALAAPLPGDAALGGWLDQQLADDAEYLAATYELAGRLRGLLGAPAPAPAPARPDIPPVPVPVPAVPPAGFVHRLSFGVDVINYSGRTAPQQAEVQRRIAELVEQVLEGIGVAVPETDRQPAGDGMIVVLPTGLDVPRAVSALLHGWRSALAADNARHTDDRIRARLSAAAGPVAVASIGFAGATVIEVGRLLDSQVLRAAAAERVDADVVALISDRLHADVVGQGFPGLDAAEFESRTVEVKMYRAQAWLWSGVAVQPSSGPSPAAAAPDPRRVFVIHGRDAEARRAVYGLLRDLGLRPLDWMEIVARTGTPSPFVGEVLEQAFAEHQAAVVVITPDDGVMLHPSLHGADEDPAEVAFAGQARPNVLFEAGMALGLQRDRTLVVEIGRLRPFASLTGRDVIRFTADPAEHLQRVKSIAERLRTAGCAVNLDGADWLDTGRFRDLRAYQRRFNGPA